MTVDLSVLWIIFFVLATVAVLNRLLFRPVVRVMQSREGAIREARTLAETAAAKAEAATAEFEARTGAARTEVYREMDERRRAALERRAELMTATRREAEADVAAARSRLQQQAADVRTRLEQDADALGEAIAVRVLGRSAS